MIKTQNVVTNTNQIPSTWVFQKYGELDQILNGQTLVIKSFKNPKQTTGSLAIFCGYDGQYRFKDHSTGIGGGSIMFVSYKYNISYGEAAILIMNDYSKEQEFQVKSQSIQKKSYRLISVNYRNFNLDDKQYWTQYHIRLRTLKKYNIMPIRSCILDNGIRTLEIGGRRMYMYHKDDGTPFKLYKPERKIKFWEIEEYYEGYDQFKHAPSDSIVITSSLKDTMSMENLKLGRELDRISFGGESKSLPPIFEYNFNQIYKNKYVLFDNDDTGIKMSKLYIQKGYKNIILPNIEDVKDISDLIKKVGIDKTSEIINSQL